MCLIVFSGSVAVPNTSKKMLNSNGDGCIFNVLLTSVGMALGISL